MLVDNLKDKRKLERIIIIVVVVITATISIAFRTLLGALHMLTTFIFVIIVPIDRYYYHHCFIGEKIEAQRG